MDGQEEMSQHLDLLEAYSQVLDRLMEVQKLLASLLEDDLLNRVNLIRLEVEGRRNELVSAILQDVQNLVGGG